MLYEFVDASGRSTMELGRFRSDASALKATRNIIPPPGSRLLVAKEPSGPRSVVDVEFIKPKERLLSDLLAACRQSFDPKVSSLARAYDP